MEEEAGEKAERDSFDETDWCSGELFDKGLTHGERVSGEAKTIARLAGGWIGMTCVGETSISSGSREGGRERGREKKEKGVNSVTFYCLVCCNDTYHCCFVVFSFLSWFLCIMY